MKKAREKAGLLHVFYWLARLGVIQLGATRR